MKNIKLDLSKFKHLKTDGFATTLRHPSGHTITLAHHALEEPTRKQLEALSNAAKDSETPLQADEANHKMADGGEVYDEYGYPKKQATQHPSVEQIKPNTSPTPKPGDQGQGLQDTSGYADGGNVKLQQSKKIPPQQPLQKPQVTIRKNDKHGDTTAYDTEDKRQGAVIRKFADGGETDDQGVPSALSPQAPVEPDLEDEISALPKKEENYVPELKGRVPTNPIHLDTPEMRDVMARQGAPIEDVSQQSQAPALTAAPEGEQSAEAKQASMAPQAPATPQEPQSGAPNTGSLLDTAYNTGKAGIEQQAAAEQGLGKEQAVIQEKAAAQSQELQDNYKQSYQETLNELHQHMQDVKEGQINPDKYWTGDASGNGSHSRIMTGIGMILAGFNPTSNPNAAIDFLKHNMDANIKAQTSNLESKQNLVRANLEQFHNLHEAQNMARLQQADTVAHYLDQAAATARSPMAQAAALQAKSKLAQDFIPLVRQQAMFGMMGKLTAGGSDPDTQGTAIAQIKMVNPELGKQMSDSFVPGIGMSRSMQPIPQDVRQQLVSGQKLQNSAKDVLQYAQTHTNIVPGTAQYNIGVQKAAILQQQIREGMLGTVFRESEKPLLNQFVNQNPAGAFKTLNSEPKLKTILQANESQMNTLKQNYGLPTTNAQTPQNPEAQAKAWAMAHPKDPRAAQILKRQQGK